MPTLRQNWALWNLLHAAEFVGAMSQLQMLTRQWITRTAGYAAVLTPTLAQLPAQVGWFGEAGDPRWAKLRELSE